MLARHILRIERAIGRRRGTGGLYADTPQAAASRVVLGRNRALLAQRMGQLGVKKVPIDGWEFVRAGDGTLRRFRVVTWPGPRERRPT